MSATMFLVFMLEFSTPWLFTYDSCPVSFFQFAKRRGAAAIVLLASYCYCRTRRLINIVYFAYRSQSLKNGAKKCIIFISSL